jgi:hypothetical protein
MKLKDFDAVVEERLGKCREVLTSKNKEYASDVDKLENFKQAAGMKGETPERALWGMWVKHITSIRKIVEDLDRGKVPTLALAAEKLGDNINYSLLLEGLLRERINGER